MIHIVADREDKLRLVRRREMETRIYTFWKECSKAQINLQDLINETKGFIEIVENSEGHDRREKYLSCMQRLDEFTYTVLEFNLALEKFELPLNPIHEETFNSPQKSTTKSSYTGSPYKIIKPIPSNVSGVSNTSIQQLIDLDTISPVYVPTENSTSTFGIPKSEFTIQIYEDCNVISPMKLTAMVSQTNQNSMLNSATKIEHDFFSEIGNNDIIVTTKDSLVSHTITGTDDNINAIKRDSTLEKGVNVKVENKDEATNSDSAYFSAKQGDQAADPNSNYSENKDTFIFSQINQNSMLNETESNFDLKNGSPEASHSNTIIKGNINGLKKDSTTEKSFNVLAEEIDSVTAPDSAFSSAKLRDKTADPKCNYDRTEENNVSRPIEIDKCKNIYNSYTEKGNNKTMTNNEKKTSDITKSLEDDENITDTAGIDCFSITEEDHNNVSINLKTEKPAINEVENVKKSTIECENDCAITKNQDRTKYAGQADSTKTNSAVTEHKDNSIPEYKDKDLYEKKNNKITKKKYNSMNQKAKDTGSSNGDTNKNEDKNLSVKGHNGISIQGINGDAVNWKREDLLARKRSGVVKTKFTDVATEASTKAGVLPEQARLEPSKPYQCRILHIDSPDLFYISVGNIEDINECHGQMLMYYSSLPSFTSKDAIKPLCLNYCACRIRSSIWYRALIINFDFSPNELEVYLLDVGRKYVVHYSDIHPIKTEFTKLPAFARECYLLGLEPINNGGTWNPLARELINEYSPNICTVYVREQTNETLGVLLLRKNVLINKQLIEKNLAQAGNDCHHLFALEGVDVPDYDTSIEECENLSSSTEKPPEEEKVEFGEMGAEPALDNVLEAVTGYANRDEADICRLYRGPPHVTCFKGSRCKKKHVQIHPEGWTLDKRPIQAQPMRNQDLLMPGSTVSIYVSHVASYNVVFVMLRNEESEVQTSRMDSLSPPQTLECLHARMNSVYALRLYKPLSLPPAPHELVAAQYSDGCWYRARVTETHLDGDLVEVQFMDYGNRSWVKVSELCELDKMFCVLPFQAYRCRLAGVRPTCDVFAVDQGYKMLQKLVLGYYFSALVVSTSDSDTEVALFDKEGNEVALLMAKSGVITFAPYTIIEEIIKVVPG